MTLVVSPVPHARDRGDDSHQPDEPFLFGANDHRTTMTGSARSSQRHRRAGGPRYLLALAFVAAFAIAPTRVVPLLEGLRQFTINRLKPYVRAVGALGGGYLVVSGIVAI
jgi:hypothetical protein